MDGERVISYRLDVCPECSKVHDYQLRIATKGPAGQRADPATRVLIFAGKDAAESASSLEWDVHLSCLTNGTPFVAHVAIPRLPGERVISIEQNPATTPGSAWASAVYAEWIKGSIVSQRDFCKSMITATSGAIPIYFAVLKYLGVEQVGTGWRWISIIPPVVLLGAVVAFAVALRPVGRDIDDVEDFVAFRRQRLEQIATWMDRGMLFFAAALALAVVIWLAQLFA